MKLLHSENINFYNDLKLNLEKRSQQNIPEIDEVVKKIILDINNNGDNALFKYAKKFDNSDINSLNILLSNEDRKNYKDHVNEDILKAFKVAIKNIYNYHFKQLPKNFDVLSEGVKTSSIWKPIESVGLYIPGGQAVYPSSLIMNVVPAKVAGVKRIVIVTPSKFNKIDPYLLSIMDELNISEVYQVGGAHSIAALAYGTESIKPVNKIFGPGNAYVASAKKQVFGKVGIDLIAGPSEIVVVADNKNNPDWVAADLIAQAEHDEKAQSILISNDESFINNVLNSIEELVSKLSKKTTIQKSLNNHGIVILNKDFKDITNIINFIAPEHLHLQHKNKKEIINEINNAGAIFIGEYSPEVFGDYIIGTNHILPTSGAAKFSSGLGVLDFMKRISLVEMSSVGYVINQENVAKMAEIENLEGHKLSVKIRQIEKK